MYPLDKLLEYLRTVDEVQILELLNISTEEILERFRDRIVKRRIFLEKELELFGEEDAMATDLIDSDEYEDWDEE